MATASDGKGGGRSGGAGGGPGTEQSRRQFNNLFQCSVGGPWGGTLLVTELWGGCLIAAPWVPLVLGEGETQNKGQPPPPPAPSAQPTPSTSN